MLVSPLTAKETEALSSDVTSEVSQVARGGVRTSLQSDSRTSPWATISLGGATSPHSPWCFSPPSSQHQHPFVSYFTPQPKKEAGKGKAAEKSKAFCMSVSV